MTTLPIRKVLGLGFLANGFSLFTFILILYLCLATFALAFTTVNELARARAMEISLVEGPLLPLLMASLGNTVRNALNGFWEARYGFLVFGIFGSMAAWTQQVGATVSLRWGWLGSFLCFAVILTVSIMTWAFLQREFLTLWMAESPELYRWRDTLTRSWTTEVSVSLIFALSFSYPIWAMWRWWYTRLVSSLLKVDLTSDTRTVSSQKEESTREYAVYAARLYELKRQTQQADGPRTAGRAAPMTTPPAATLASSLPQGNRYLVFVLILLVVCVILLPLANRAHQRQSLRLDHGTAFVNADTQAEETFPVEIAADSRQLRIVNINGRGIVNINLRPVDEETHQGGSIQGWTFKWREDDYLYNEIPLNQIEPGLYQLQFIQQSGWGWFEFALSHGGGRNSQTLALLIGLLLTLAVICSIVLIMAVAAKLYLRWNSR